MVPELLGGVVPGVVVAGLLVPGVVLEAGGIVPGFVPVSLDGGAVVPG